MGIASLYREAQSSFVSLARSLTEEQWAAPSPCTPGWTARDLLSHAAGVAIDVMDGNVEGAATPPWTAAQVERWRSEPVEALIERWDGLAADAAEALEAFGEARAIVDCHTHEHDLRCAVGEPGTRASPLVGWIAERFVGISVGPPLDLEYLDGSVRRIDGSGSGSGPDAALRLSGLTEFELFRSRLGRRSADQVRAYDWSRPVPDDVLDGWFLFGPSETPIEE